MNWYKKGNREVDSVFNGLFWKTVNDMYLEFDKYNRSGSYHLVRLGLTVDKVLQDQSLREKFHLALDTEIFFVNIVNGNWVSDGFMGTLDGKLVIGLQPQNARSEYASTLLHEVIHVQEKMEGLEEVVSTGDMSYEEWENIPSEQRANRSVNEIMKEFSDNNELV